MKRQFSNWVEYNGRPNKRLQPTPLGVIVERRG
jgi:hypothetical protein